MKNLEFSALQKTPCSRHSLISSSEKAEIFLHNYVSAAVQIVKKKKVILTTLSSKVFMKSDSAAAIFLRNLFFNFLEEDINKLFNIFLNPTLELSCF